MQRDFSSVFLSLFPEETSFTCVSHLKAFHLNGFSVELSASFHLQMLSEHVNGWLFVQVELHMLLQMEMLPHATMLSF